MEGTAAGRAAAVAGRGCRTKVSFPASCAAVFNPFQTMLHAGFGGGAEERQASLSCTGVLGSSQVQGSSGGGAGRGLNPKI